MRDSLHQIMYLNTQAFDNNTATFPWQTVLTVMELMRVFQYWSNTDSDSTFFEMALVAEIKISIMRSLGVLIY